MLSALRANKGTSTVTEIVSRVSTIPDLPIGAVFGVTDIENARRPVFPSNYGPSLPLLGLPSFRFNLIISDRTRTIPLPLSRAIRQTRGKVYIFNSKTEAFVEAVLDGNKVIN